MGVRITTKKHGKKATARLIGQISSYLIEQEYEEFIQGDKAILEAAVNEFVRVLNK